MANLIKRIAVSTARKTGQADIAKEFQSNSSNTLSRRQSVTLTQQSHLRGQFHELDSITSFATDGQSETRVAQSSSCNQIKQTTEVVISRELNVPYSSEKEGPEIRITGGHVNTGGRRKSAASTAHAAMMPTQQSGIDDNVALVGRDK